MDAVALRLWIWAMNTYLIASVISPFPLPLPLPLPLPPLSPSFVPTFPVERSWLRSLTLLPLPPPSAVAVQAVGKAAHESAGAIASLKALLETSKLVEADLRMQVSRRRRVIA